MTKAELRKIIVEAVKKAKAKNTRTAASYITSPTETNPTLYINITVSGSDMDETEDMREKILKTLQQEFNIKPTKQD
jgi:multidrug efflux pump subunit AcrB